MIISMIELRGCYQDNSKLTLLREVRKTSKIIEYFE